MPVGQRPFAIGASKTDILAPPQAFAEEFRACRSILCPGILEPDILDAMMARCRTASFTADTVYQVGLREVETPQRLGIALNLLLRRRNLMDWIMAATGCASLDHVEGRVAQTRAGSTDALDWHDDDLPARQIAIALHLSDAPFDGGEFQLRGKSGAGLLRSVGYCPPGTALLFDVSPDMEHCVLPVRAGGPRRVFSGWFFQSARK